MDFPDIENKYPLECQYNIWSHQTNNSDWSPTSYTLLHTFDTLRGFCDFFQKHPEPQLGMFFIMKDPIVPTWEDVHNAPGGCWSFKLNKSNHINIWTKLTASFIGKTLTNDVESMSYINGISLTVRRHNIIMKIWNNDREKNDINIIRNDLEAIKLSDSIYQQHKGRE